MCRPLPTSTPPQVEDYEVLEGTFEVVVDGEWSVLQPGDRASVPVGALHTFRNTCRGRRSASATATLRRCASRSSSPRSYATLRQAGVSTGPRDPRIPMLISMVMLRYWETLYPGRRRERIPMKALAAVAKRLPGPRG